MYSTKIQAVIDIKKKKKITEPTTKQPIEVSMLLHSGSSLSALKNQKRALML